MQTYLVVRVVVLVGEIVVVVILVVKLDHYLFVFIHLHSELID